MLPPPSPGDDQVLAALLSLTCDAVVVADAERRITSWNEAAERLYGYARGEVLGQPLGVVLPLAADATPGRSRAQHRDREGRLLDVDVSQAQHGGGLILLVKDLGDDVRQQRRTAALRRAVRRCALEHDPTSLLQALLEEAVTAIDVDVGAVFLWDEEQEGLVKVGATGEGVPEFPLIHPGEGMLGDAVRHRRALTVDNYADVANRIATVVSAGVTAVAVAPFLHEARPLGAIWVGCRGGRARFSGDEAETLELFAEIGTATLAGLRAARLDGVLLAARTAEHEVNNRLVATCAYSQYILRDPTLPEHLRDKASAAARGARDAATILRTLRDIAEIRETRWGPDRELTTIDLSASPRQSG